MKYKIECFKDNSNVPNNFHYDSYVELKNNYSNLSLMPKNQKLTIFKYISLNNYVQISLPDLKDELIDDFIKNVVQNEWNDYVLANSGNSNIEDFLLGVEQQRWSDFIKTH